MSSPDAMSDEFDLVAEWTAQVAIDLGPDYYVPAGCRGSGSPAALAWLVDTLAPEPSDRMLDCGAGVGGPAAFAAERAGVRALLVDPEPGACRAAGRLFGLPTVRATAADLPFDRASFDVAWCLAVLCTTRDQLRLLTELRRVLRPGGRLGLLVFTTSTGRLRGQPEGNHFPTDIELAALLSAARLEVEATAHTADFADEPPGWRRRFDAVEAELDRRHHADDAWQTAQDQASRFGRLLDSGDVRGSLFVLRAD